MVRRFLGGPGEAARSLWELGPMRIPLLALLLARRPLARALCEVPIGVAPRAAPAPAGAGFQPRAQLGAAWENGGDIAEVVEGLALISLESGAPARAATRSAPPPAGRSI